MSTYSPAIEDWDDAYANADHIEDAAGYISKWESLAKAYRSKANCELNIAYAEGERNKLDLFLPEGKPRGLFVFVHGGYWLRFDHRSWSHLAKGIVAMGYAVAMPSYTLCPENTIPGIVSEIAKAISKAAEMIEGPIILSGHSAGGHLVTRLVCQDSALPESVRNRVEKVISISGVHDLRPLQNTKMNASLQLNDQVGAAHSPALLKPIDGLKLHCVVGANERPEFIRQNALLANVWSGLGASVKKSEIPATHHFNVIEHIADFV